MPAGKRRKLDGIAWIVRARFSHRPFDLRLSGIRGEHEELLLGGHQ